MGIVTLPELNTPFPSRINPLVDEAEQECRSFMRRFGLVTSEKAAAHYDAHRFGEQTARCYPDAALPELRIVVGWMTTAFIFDDYLEALGAWCDRDELQRVLGTVRTWLGIGDHGPQHADTPLAAAFGDLWRRTAPRSSTSWQRRFLRTLTDYHRGCEDEAALRWRRQMNDVASSILLRRDNAAPRFGFALGELAGRYVLPDALLADRRMIGVQNAASDAITVGNDLLGLEADLVHGVRNNTVLALLYERGGTLQDAADEAGEIFRSRIEQITGLENELPTCYEELGLHDETRADATRYIRTLHDWIEGGLAWQRTSGRYRILDSLTDADLPNPLVRLAAVGS
jgi:Terpene synthase family 2, C-terminal metal binding